MAQADELKEEEERLTKIINESHCGYCKEVIGGARDIIKIWNSIADKAMEIDRLKNERMAFLSDASTGADKLLSKYMPQQTAEKGTTVGGIAKNIRPVKLAKRWFGDYLNGLLE
jgi:hypothetical protein